MGISFSGYSYGGFKGNELKVSDDLGNVLRQRRTSMDDFEFSDVDPKAKRITVEAFSEDQLQEARHDFVFHRLPAHG